MDILAIMNGQAAAPLTVENSAFDLATEYLTTLCNLRNWAHHGAALQEILAREGIHLAPRQAEEAAHKALRLI